MYNIFLIVWLSLFQIQSLLPLRENTHYAKLKQLIAPDNYITSLDDLIGSPFTNNKPTTLNLQLNRISNVREFKPAIIIY